MRSGRGRVTLIAATYEAMTVPTPTRWDELDRRLAEVAREDVVLERDAPLASRTTLRIGGRARVRAGVLSRDGVAALVSAVRDTAVPWIVLGLGANVLVPDEGLDAVVIQLEGALTEIDVEGRRLRAGGGASWSRVVRASIDAGLAGIECLGGIPSSLGGALAMNAGAYGQEVLDVLGWAEVVEPDGSVRRLARGEVEGGYRWSVLGRGRIVTGAELELQPDDGAAIRARARQARDRRLKAMPSEPSAGSVFRNPPGDHAGRLLEAAGCKGLQRGGARVSERHANVVVNSSEASAADVRALIGEMARRVRDAFGIRLELELKVLDRQARVRTDPGSL